MVKMHPLTTILTAIFCTALIHTSRAQETVDLFVTEKLRSGIFLADSQENDTERTLSALFESSPAHIATDDLWDTVRQGFGLADLDSILVKQQEQLYLRNPEYIHRIVSRCNRYLYHIVAEVQKRGMPTELALLPIIESAFNPRAESPANASGIWQFIPSTGRMYGLERTWWYDGRRDVVAATDAALNYLQRLYDIFGDWQLALAAYNWGDGSVKRAQAKNIVRGLPTDYLSITMPTETRNYVPKLLAIRNIIANPLAFGVRLAMIPNKPYFTTVAPKKHMDITVAAKLAEVAVEELLNLNPGYIRPVIAHKKDRQLVLPVANAETFTKNLAQYDQPLLNWQPYITKRGESFSAIAHAHRVTVDDLRLINSLPHTTAAARGQTILVPIQHALSTDNKPILTAFAANHPDEADNKTLEGLSTVVTSNNQEITPTQDFRLLKGKSVLTKHTPAIKEAETKKPKHYEVKRGDTLYSIAKQFNVSPQILTTANRLQNNQIHGGQVLLIPSQE